MNAQEPLDPDIANLVRTLDDRLGEFLQGYVLIGFTADTEKPLQIIRHRDTKTAMALNTMLAHAALAGTHTPTNEHSD